MFEKMNELIGTIVKTFTGRKESRKDDIREDVRQAIEDAFDSQWGLEKTSDGYEYTIYRDRGDEPLEESTVRELMDDSDPMTAFESCIESLYSPCLDNILNEVEEIVARKAEAVHGDLTDDERALIRDMTDKVYAVYPEDDFLKEEYCVDIYIGVDGASPYTCNNMQKGDDGVYRLPENSALIWLAKEQGYGTDELHRALLVGSESSKFLRSVKTEYADAGPLTKALVICVKLTLKDLLRLAEAKHKGSDWALVIDKGTACGLYDPYTGAGSNLDIVLEKAVRIPIAYMDSFYPDPARGYDSIRDVYAVTSKMWAYGRDPLLVMGNVNPA